MLKLRAFAPAVALLLAGCLASSPISNPTPMVPEVNIKGDVAKTALALITVEMVKDRYLLRSRTDTDATFDFQYRSDVSNDWGNEITYSAIPIGGNTKVIATVSRYTIDERTRQPGPKTPGNAALRARVVTILERVKAEIEKQ